MTEIIDLQTEPEPEPDSPKEEKASNISYTACNNSYQSQAWCFRW